MEKINYQLSKFDDSNNSVHVIFGDTKYEIIENFFFEFTKRNYLNVLENAIEGYGFGFNAGGVVFPKDYDEWEEGLPENMVEFNLFDDKLMFPRLNFLEILLAAAREMLKIQVENENPSEDWIKEMQTKIKELEEYIKSPDFTP